MLAVHAAPTTGLVRNATIVDTAEIDRLLASTSRDLTLPITATDVATWIDNGHLLVLDAGDGTLAGVVHLVLHDGDGEVDLLAVDPDLVGCDLIEDRIVGVAHAMSVAHGCDRMRRRSARRSRGRR